MGSTWIDISVSLRNGMVHWPGDPPFHIERVFDLECGDPATVSMVTMGVHTGTHLDAPLHFIRAGAPLDAMPLDATVGPARVIGIEDRKSIKPAELSRHDLRRGERVLFRTRNSARCWDSAVFVEDFVYLTPDAARLLADREVRCVGVDYLSVGAYDGDGRETHEVLLAAGVWIIEGLNLAALQPGRYDLICLPLRLGGAEGAPARAILRPRVAGGRRHQEMK